MTQNTVNYINAIIGAMVDTGKPDPKAVAVALEANQRWIEHLDELLDNLPEIKPETAVVVKVNGTTIKFKNAEDMAAWITTLSK